MLFSSDPCPNVICPLKFFSGAIAWRALGGVAFSGDPNLGGRSGKKPMLTCVTACTEGFQLALHL